MDPPLTDQFSRPLLGPDGQPIKEVVRTGTKAVMYFISLKEADDGDYFPSPDSTSDRWLGSDTEGDDMFAGIESY